MKDDCMSLFIGKGFFKLLLNKEIINNDEYKKLINEYEKNIKVAG